MSFLNDVVGLFEAEMDAEGNFSELPGFPDSQSQDVRLNPAFYIW